MKQIFVGNVALAVCAAFYLAWWILAFKPTGALKGFATGWLLLPAVLAGVAALVLICGGVIQAPRDGMIVRPLFVAAAGAALFVALVAVTGGVMARPVTTELVLIVGWATLSVCQLVALTAMGVWGKAAAVAQAAYIAAATLVSLGCYMAYYKLDGLKGWIDGMVPLVAALVGAIVTALSALAKLI